MKSHRGISAVVGTVFLIAVIISALSYVTYSLEIMGNFSEQLISEESRQKDLLNEKFELTFVNVTSSNKLDATIKNTGQIPLEITTLYLDEQGTNDVVQKIIIDKTIAPGRSFNFLTEGIDVDALSSAGYSMKLVSSRGETQTFYLNSPSQEFLDIQLVAIPDVIPTTFTTTLVMTVINNMSNNSPLVNLTPNDPTFVCDITTCTKISGPTPTTYESLEHGDIAIFRWVYELTGDDDDDIIFTSSLQNQISGNEDTALVTLNVPEFAKIAGTSITTVGIGSSEFSRDIFYLHQETSSIPPLANYRMQLLEPDNTGTVIPFTDGTVKQWFSANATVEDIDIPAGTWNASLTYTSPILPDALPAAADVIWTSIGEGLAFHFNTDQAVEIEASVDNHCGPLTQVANGGGMSGVTWGSAFGRDNSGGYYFDGDDDYIAIGYIGGEATCTQTKDLWFSIAGWINADNGGPNTQTILSKMDGDAGYEIELVNGEVTFTIDDKGAKSICADNADVRGDGWHHFVAMHYEKSKCRLYFDGSQAAQVDGGGDHDHGDTTMYLGAKDGNTNEFEGYMDDIMMWTNYVLTGSDVTTLYEYSFGDNAHLMDAYITNATGEGTTVDTWPHYAMPLPWSDPTSGLDGYGTGGNLTMSMPQVGLNILPLNNGNRLNFTLSNTDTGGEDISLIFDDQALDGEYPIPRSSFLQLPIPAEPLPVYFNLIQSQKVAYFAYNTGDEGAWFTYQGTRIVFNATDTTGHYTGIVDSVWNGVDDLVHLSATQDGPFIDKDATADIVFWQPQKAPQAAIPDPADYIPIGTYDVTVYVNGYDEDGTVFVQSLDIGTILVIP